MSGNTLGAANPPPSALDKHAYLQLISEHAAMIGDAAQRDPDAWVPACPEWQLRDLAVHAGHVAAMWTEVVRSESVERPDLGQRPAAPSDAQLDTFVRDHIDELVEALAAASDDTPAWNWWGDPTVRWIPRRVAHEMIVHAGDAASAAGGPFDVAAAVGVDGITEFFSTVLPRTRGGFEGPEAILVLDPTDSPTVWSVLLSPDAQPQLVAGHRPPQAVLRAPAGKLLLMLWRRTSVSDAEVEGDRELVDRMLAYPRLG